MGDRANVRMKYQHAKGEEGKTIYLYTHWQGSDLPLTVKRALLRKQRWNDAAYLARIVFSEMVKGQEGEETGFGIAPYMCDNEHTIIELEPEKQAIKLYGFSYLKEEKEPFFTTTFARYIEMSDEEILARFQREI